MTLTMPNQVVCNHLSLVGCTYVLCKPVCMHLFF